MTGVEEDAATGKGGREASNGQEWAPSLATHNTHTLTLTHTRRPTDRLLEPCKSSQTVSRALRKHSATCAHMYSLTYVCMYKYSESFILLICMYDIDSIFDPSPNQPID